MASAPDVGVYMNPELFGELGVEVFKSEGLSFRAALGIFGAGTARHSGITLGSRSMISWCCRSRILLWCRKLPLFSRPFVDWDNLSFMGWPCNLLNLVAWVRSLASLRASRGWRSVMVSSSWIGVDFMAPVIIRLAWFWTLLIRSVGFGCGAPCSHAILQHWPDCTSV